MINIVYWIKPPHPVGHHGEHPFGQGKRAISSITMASNTIDAGFCVRIYIAPFVEEDGSCRAGCTIERSEKRRRNHPRPLVFASIPSPPIPFSLGLLVDSISSENVRLYAVQRDERNPH